MRTRFIIAAMLLLTVTFTATAQAEKVVFYEDPVFKPLNDGDEHPMADLIKLSDNGDTRAQFILGDLYAKGKGGLVKNLDKAKHWFNQSAMNGYGASFIRLGALAKNQGNMVEAYSWYDLGASLAGGKDGRYAAKARDALKLSSEDEDKADALSDAWRKERSAASDARDEAERAKREAEREAQKTVEAAKKAAEQAADKKDGVDVKKVDPKKPIGKKAEVKTEEPAPRYIKQRGFNE